VAGETGKSVKKHFANIQLRPTPEQLSLINRAAQTLGSSPADFMMETACREAKNVLADRIYFSLPEEQFRRFTTLLEVRPARNPAWRNSSKPKFHGISNVAYVLQYYSHCATRREEYEAYRSTKLAATQGKSASSRLYQTHRSHDYCRARGLVARRTNRDGSGENA
jgi:uncharacterized protein (DUF1778 family)